jgi:HAD superfamily hydrolase (TIGR01509 family)
MIEAVIFDVDGTLIDSVDLHAAAWQEALAKYGIEVPFDAIRRQIGKGGDQLLPVFLTKQQLNEFGERLEKDRGAIFKKKYLPQARAFPGVRALFERIRADGKRIALASSAKADELKHYKRLADIEDLVDVATSNDDADRSKPFPDIFQAALERLGLRPSQAIAVGDTPWDALAATEAGLKIIGFLCGGFPEAELREAGCIAIYEGPQDLLNRYEQSPQVREKATA